MATDDKPKPGEISNRILREDEAEQRRRSGLQVHFEDDGRPAQNPNRLPPEERYHRDPMFHALVDQLRFAIERADYTPTEIREAAMLAAIIVERYRPARPFRLMDPA